MTVAVGMSGGVDSTMAVWLLLRQGHRVVGLTMQIWDGTHPLPDVGRSGCYGPGEARDLEAARAAAARLGIPHHTIPLAEAYGRCVLDPFRAAYRSGRTPNPCVVCNTQLKFGLLPDRARGQGIAFDAFATGHYVRLAFEPVRGRYVLRTGLDPRKDQSYFLSRLTQEQLRGLLFPLGGLTKAEVQALAREAGFGDVAGRAESQDFVEAERYTDLFAPADSRPGPLVDMRGRVLGRHPGIVHFTVGQRHGLGVATGERLYVREIRASDDTVVLGTHDELLRPSCRLEQANWLAGTPPPDGAACRVRLRYRHPGVEAVLHRLDADTWETRFAVPQFAVAPGQAAVCYAGDELLGGGWIGG